MNSTATQTNADRLRNIYRHLTTFKAMTPDQAITNISSNLNISKNAVVCAVAGLVK